MIHATHFIDKHYYEVVLDYGDYLINGHPVQISYGGKKSITVNGDNLEARLVKSETVISHYEHRENGNRISYADYCNIQSGYRDSHGKYKTIEDEYASKKMSLDYLPVKRVIEEVGDPIIIAVENVKEDAGSPFIKPLFNIIPFDKYLTNIEWNLIYEYREFDHFSSFVQEYMESVGYKRFKCFDRKSDEDFYVLNSFHDYTKLAMRGSEHLYTNNGLLETFRGKYDDVLSRSKSNEEHWKNVINKVIDNTHSTMVRDSTIKKLKDILANFPRGHAKTYKALSEAINEIEINKK